jgi:N4-gp56 family major capsid protein
MSNINTTANISDAVGVWYGPNLLDIATPMLIADQFGQKKSIPRNRSERILWSRYEEFDEATTELTEGVEPEGQSVDVTRMDALCSQYGDVVIMTDVVELTVEDPVANQVNMRLGEQAGRTFDTLTFDVIKATGSIYNCKHGGNLKTPSNITQADVDTIVQSLFDNDAKMWTAIMSGSTNVGTAPLDESYYCMTNTAIYRDLKNLDSWVPANQYPKPEDRKAGERGYTDNMRWCMSSKAPLTANGDLAGTSTVYDFYAVGRDAYGVVDISGGNMESIYTAPGGPGDRLKQKSSLGWKGWHAAKILNDLALIRGRCTLNS